MDLHVRPSVSVKIEESTALNHIGRKQTLFEQKPFKPVAQRFPSLVLAEKADGLFDVSQNRRRHVVLEVLSDCRKIAQNRNSKLLKLIDRAKPGQHHQLWRGESPSRQHHARAGMRLNLRASYFVFDAACCMILQDDPGDGGTGLDRQSPIALDPT